MSNQINREKVLPKEVAESLNNISELVKCQIALQGTSWKNHVPDLLNSVFLQIQQSQESES
jgi:hypothetical protein